MDEGRYMLVVNAANRDKDFAWIKAHVTGDVRFQDISDTLAEIALQGPKAPEILAKLSDTIPEKYYTLIEKGRVAGIDCIVSRTGYTGELGFEFYCAPDRAAELCDKLLEAGAPLGLIPCGLGARDTLRLEAAMPLYGHEMDETITPFEASLNFAIKMDKPDFIGKAALIGKETPGRKRTGIKITGRGIARGGEEVFSKGALIGKTTSGTFCPFLKEAVAMAMVNARYAAPGTAVEVDVRGRKIEGQITELPFYRRNK
jgi:aminomethyltransferase